MSQIKKANIIRWTKALRSGKYSQCKRRLQSPSGYCCLGVACEIFTPTQSLFKDYESRITGTMPHHQAFVPFWLKDLPDDFIARTGKNLTSLNDGNIHQFSFDEIADLLELVYIHEILN